MEINVRTYCVYVHTNKTNGKMYVGQTCQKPEKRWKNGDGYKGCSYFYHAIQKYGWENFEHEIIASNLTLDEANNFEALLIEKLDTMNPQKGYNLRSGGENSLLSEYTKGKIRNSLSGENHPMYGKLHTEETKEKIRRARQGKCCGEDNPNYGKHLSDTIKEKLRIANIGKKHAEETKRKMSESSKGHNNPNYMKPMTEEQKMKISKTKTGATTVRTKSVLQYDINGNFIRRWDLISQASKELKICANNISYCCKGKYKTAGGFIWRYADQSLTQQND